MNSVRNACAGEGDFLALKPGQHMWETNFVPDLGALSLPDWEARGAGKYFDETGGKRS